MGSMKHLPLCKHNIGVECSKYQRKCEACGWNPEIIKQRKVEIRQKRAEEEKKYWSY